MQIKAALEIEFNICENNTEHKFEKFLFLYENL